MNTWVYLKYSFTIWMQQISTACSFYSQCSLKDEVWIMKKEKTLFQAMVSSLWLCKCFYMWYTQKCFYLPTKRFKQSLCQCDNSCSLVELVRNVKHTLTQKYLTISKHIRAWTMGSEFKVWWGSFLWIQKVAVLQDHSSQCWRGKVSLIKQQHQREKE